MHRRPSDLRSWTALLALTPALGGCANLAPKYQQPQTPVSAEWPQGAAYAPFTSAPAAVSAIDWREFYRDERLRPVVELSLLNNRDLRIATLNIERARALYRIQHADQFPTIEAVASGTAQKIPGRSRRRARSPLIATTGSRLASPRTSWI